MTTLEPGGVIRAASLGVPLEALPHAQVEAGAPRAGSVALAGFEGLEVGVWEHTPGVSTDVEIDEVFVVLSGAARIDMVEPEGESLEVGPGDVVRLVAGQRTRWTVTETLRKIYLA